MFNAKDINSSIKTGGSKIPAGIHLNVRLTNVTVDESFIEFDLQDTQGRIQNNRVWIPELDKTSARGEKTVEQVYEENVQNRLKQITQYLRAFLTDDELAKFSAESFSEYAKKAAQVLNARLNNATLNVKLIKTADLMFSDFPFYPPYAEKYVEDQPSTLKFSAWELQNRMGEPEKDDTSGEKKDDFKLF